MNDSGRYGWSLRVITCEIDFLLLTCLLCDFFFSYNEAGLFFWEWGKEQKVGSGKGGDKQYLNSSKQPPSGQRHRHTHAYAHVHTHQLQWSGDYAGEMGILFLLLEVTGMNVNWYNAYEGAIWQHTGTVFKMSACGSCKSIIKNIPYSVKDLARQGRLHSSEYTQCWV